MSLCVNILPHFGTRFARMHTCSILHIMIPFRLLGTILLSATPLLAQQGVKSEKPLRRIAFGSCFKETRKGPIFNSVAASKPQLFIWLGDNIYGDSHDPAVLRQKWQNLAEHADVKPNLNNIPQIATWDDHDYGKNDAGKEFPIKKEAQTAFLDWLNVPTDSPRRSREGIYSVQDYGPEDRLTRIILLDTRYHRDALPEHPENGETSDGTILGEEQWAWLEQQLRSSKAQVNIIGTSIQFLASEHRFEKWSNYPKERARLLKLLSDPTVPPVILLSGDRHSAEISVDKTSTGYPLYDVTSSSLNLPFGGKKPEPNALRLGEKYKGANFGTISIDWYADSPIITLALRDSYGAPQRAVTYNLTR